jgi:hypothetical protein
MNIIKNRKVIAVVSLAFFIAALVLECLPSAQTLAFGVSSSSGEFAYKYIHYHFFDLTPVGYAHFTPFLTGLLTIAGIILFGISLFKPNLRRYNTILAVVTAIFSVIHMFVYSLEAFTATGIIISALLFTTSIINIVQLEMEHKRHLAF